MLKILHMLAYYTLEDFQNIGGLYRHKDNLSQFLML